MSNQASNGPSIVARLRAAHPYSAQYANGSNLLAEAADEIERLTAANGQLQGHGHEMWSDVKRLRAALTGMRARLVEWNDGSEDPKEIAGSDCELISTIDCALGPETGLNDCPACSVGNPGVYIKDGRMVCPHRPE